MTKRQRDNEWKVSSLPLLLEVGHVACVDDEVGDHEAQEEQQEHRDGNEGGQGELGEVVVCARREREDRRGS